jgi:hypothetical protein
MLKPLGSLFVAGLFLSVSAWGQAGNACDLNQDGKVDAADVQAAINASIGLSACNANIYGAGVCNVVVVQRVVNASLGGTCLTGTGSISHSVSLNWAASTSGNVSGYKVYRGPYSAVSTLGIVTSYTDQNVQSGQTYYYVTTALAGTVESGFSNQAQAIVPVP